MAPNTLTRTLCVLPFLLHLALSHMQMEVPSPLRDPHSNRANEPKDYNILTPLHADGSDFTCKGYQWNTPLVPVATYQAGESYEMRLKGGATHGGGSCQISMSCNNGKRFKVLKSIVGGCPLQKSYTFTIPAFARSGKCMLAWTWFNKVGNREMYMNCAVVNIVGAGDDEKRDVSSAAGTAVAQAALSRLPDLFVANLKSINDCTVRETVDANFPDPGDDVEYADGMSPSSAVVKRSDGGACTGVGRQTGSGTVASWPSGGDSTGSSTGGNDWQWHGSDNAGGSDSASATSQCNDGQYHPECFTQPSAATASDATETSSDGDYDYVYEYYDPSVDTTPDDNSRTSLKGTLPNRRGKEIKFSSQHDDAGEFHEDDNQDAGRAHYDYGAGSYPYGGESDTFNRQIPARTVFDEEEPTVVATTEGDEDPAAKQMTEPQTNASVPAINSDSEDADEQTPLGLAAAPTSKQFESEPFDIGHWVDELAKLNQGPSEDIDPSEADADLYDEFGDDIDDAFSVERLPEQKKHKFRGKAANKSKSKSKSKSKHKGKKYVKSSQKHHSHVSYSSMEAISTPTPAIPQTPSPVYTPAAVYTPLQIPANATTPTSTSSSNPAACPNLPYATGDPNAFLPCNPGSFLCKSPNEYYTCGQFGGSEWTYGALRQAAGGMTCIPGTATSESKSKRGLLGGFFVKRVIRDGDSAGAEPSSLFDKIVGKLDTLSERVNVLLQSYTKEVVTADQGIGYTSTWGTTLELLKRHLAGIVPSDIENPNDALDIISSKIENLSSAVDRLAKYYTSRLSSAKRSLLWHNWHDQYSSGKPNLDPLAPMLKSLDGVIVKLELLLDNENGGQSIGKIAIARSKNARAPVFVRLEKLEELVSQLPPSEQLEKRQIEFFDDENDDGVVAKPVEFGFPDMLETPVIDDSGPVPIIGDDDFPHLDKDGVGPLNQSVIAADSPPAADTRIPLAPESETGGTTPLNPYDPTDVAQSTTEGEAEGEAESVGDNSSEDNHTQGPSCHPKQPATAVPELETDNSDDVDNYEEEERQEYEQRWLLKRQRGRYWDDDISEPDQDGDVGKAAELMFGKMVNPKYRNAHGGGPTGPTFQPNGDKGDDAETAQDGEGEEVEVGEEDDDSAPTQDDDSAPEQDEPTKDHSAPTSSSTDPEPSGTGTTATSATQTPNSTPLSSLAAQSDYEEAVLVPASDDAPENGASDDAELSGNEWFVRRDRESTTKVDKKGEDEKKKKDKKKKQKLSNDGVADESALEALFGPEPKDYQAKIDKAKSEDEKPSGKKSQHSRRQTPPPHINGIDEKVPTIPNFEDLPSADASDVKVLFPDLEPPAQDGIPPNSPKDVANLLPATDLENGDEDVGVPLEVDATDLEVGAHPDAPESEGVNTIGNTEELLINDSETPPSSTPAVLEREEEEEDAVPPTTPGTPSVELISPPTSNELTDEPVTLEPTIELPSVPLPNTTTSIPTFANASSPITTSGDEAGEVDEGNEDGDEVDWEDGTLFPYDLDTEETPATEGIPATEDSSTTEDIPTAENTTSVTNSSDTPASEEVPDFLPLILGPGPVVPPGLEIDWPGPLGSNHEPVFDEPTDGIPGVIGGEGEDEEDGVTADQVGANAGTDDAWLKRRVLNKVEIVQRAVRRRRAVVEALMRRGCEGGARDDGFVPTV